MVRKTFTTAALVAALTVAALPATAATPGCIDIGIDDAQIVSLDNSSDGQVAVALYAPGSWTLQVQIGPDQVGLGEGIGTTHQLPENVASVTACADGSVNVTALHEPAPVPEPVSDGVERITPDELAELDPEVQATVPEHRIAYDFRPLAWR